jgi:hypothetical protein
MAHCKPHVLLPALFGALATKHLPIGTALIARAVLISTASSSALKETQHSVCGMRDWWAHSGAVENWPGPFCWECAGDNTPRGREGRNFKGSQQLTMQGVMSQAHYAAPCNTVCM